MDSYSCSLAQTAIKPDYTTGLLGKTVNLTEAEAGPFPDGFRRKERVESANLHYLTAATRIRDLNFHTGDLSIPVIRVVTVILPLLTIASRALTVRLRRACSN